MNNDLKELITKFAEYYNWCANESGVSDKQETVDLLLKLGCRTAVNDLNANLLSVTFPDDEAPVTDNTSMWSGQEFQYQPGPGTESPTTNDKAKAMKPFNLDDAKAGKAVCTGIGEARILCYDAIGDFPVIAALKDVVGDEYPAAFSSSGVGNFNAKCDLFMKTERKEGWINIYQEFHNRVPKGSSVFPRESEADMHAKNCLGTLLLATVKVEWEE